MRMFTMICAAALAVCGVAGAVSNDLVKVHFDRPVMVGEKVVPAGDYTIQKLDPAKDDSGILLLRSKSGVQTTMMTNRLDAADSPSNSNASVTLSRHGDTYQLDSVWMSDTEGFQVLEPSR